MTSVNGGSRISVVAATCDRPERLSRMLDALERQTVGADFEVIVVDDASDGATAVLLAQRAHEVKRFRLTALRQDVRRGPAAARNLGWRAAKAPLIAFTDDDCEPDPGWLQALLDADRGDAVLQGRTEANPAEHDAGGPFSRSLEVHDLGPWYPTCNMAFPRAVLERLGGFDEGYPLPGGEDTDLAWRALEVGVAPALVPDAVVYHAVTDLGPLGKLRLATRWAPAFQIFRRHPGLRSHLTWGVFWKRSHALLLLALLGVALGRRFPPAVLLAAPYARDVRARMSAEGASPAVAPYYAVHDAVETATAATGSLRHGTLVL